MKQLIAREVLYFFVALIVAVPVSLFFLYMVNHTPDQQQISADEQVLEMDLLLIGAIIGFVGVYIARLTVWGVKQLIAQQ